MSEESPIYNFEPKTKLEEGLRYFIGVKQIQARPMTFGDYNIFRGWGIPENEDPARPGYLVVYPDGYQSWSPQETFESAYLPMTGDGSRITLDMVEGFIDVAYTERMGNHLVAYFNTRAGFSIVETGACVDAKNFDVDIGVGIARKKAMDHLWAHLGFVLAWARNGIEPKPVD
jgi:hypothetical protein